jgi:hypothetical protein
MHESLRLDEAVEFADNPEPRVHVSFAGYIWLYVWEPINALNEGSKSLGMS